MRSASKQKIAKLPTARAAFLFGIQQCFAELII
jgi:hypothetical protein